MPPPFVTYTSPILEPLHISVGRGLSIWLRANNQGTTQSFSEVFITLDSTKAIMLAKNPQQHILPKTRGKVQTPDDLVLWQSFRKGNDLAFSLLYNKYIHRLYNYGMHACRDRDIVLDCLQELFARLWDKRENISDTTSVNFYLFKAFRNTLVNRVNSKRFLIPFLHQHHDVLNFSPSFEEVQIEEEGMRERYKRLNMSLAELTKRQREAIFLKFFNNMTYEEVAAVMELRVDSVYNLISKAIDVLRKKLKYHPFLLPLLFYLAP